MLNKLVKCMFFTLLPFVAYISAGIYRGPLECGQPRHLWGQGNIQIIQILSLNRAPLVVAHSGAARLAFGDCYALVDGRAESLLKDRRKVMDVEPIGEDRIAMLVLREGALSIAIADPKGELEVLESKLPLSAKVPEIRKASMCSYAGGAETRIAVGLSTVSIVRTSTSGVAGEVSVVRRGGDVLFTVRCEDKCPGFGSAVVTYDDVDADDVADLLVGAPDCTLGMGRGTVSVLSGSDGTVLGRFGGPKPSQEVVHPVDFGYEVVTVQPNDKTHLRDIYVGAPGSAQVMLVKGGSWEIARTIDCPGGSRGWLSEFGLRLACRDVNGDGKDDLFVGAPKWTEEGRGRVPIVESGAIWVLDGQTAGILCNWTGTKPFDQVGRSLDTQVLSGGAGTEVFYSSTRGAYHVVVK